MNREKWEKLTPKEQRVMVHNCRGLKCYEDDDTYGLVWYPFDDDAIPEKVPDYLNDLNTMHEVIGAMNIWELKSYREELMKICGGLWVVAVDATAEERAEAFVLAMEPEDD